MSALPRISVIIATRNRADMTRLVLESLVTQSVAPEEFETIVVDNGSTDHTAAMVEQMMPRLPGLRYLAESRTGLSWARNAGLAAAQSPLAAYIDDDAPAEPQWLESLLAAFAQSPQPACVAGPVYLNWRGLPQNVPSRYWTLLSHLDYGSQDRALRDNEYVVGANMAFDRDTLRRLGGFDTQLGRHGTKLLSGEEAQVVARVRQDGGMVYYAARAAVWHIVQPERVKPEWLWRRIFWDGASQPVMDGAAGRDRSYCALQAYRDLKRITLFLLRAGAAWCRRDPEGSRDFALYATQRAGRLRTHLRLMLLRSAV